MAEPAPKLVTVEEFLAFEGEGDHRYELLDGAIVMMAPPVDRHGRLVVRLATALGMRLRRPCEPGAEADILLPWSAHDFCVADLAVSCARPSGDERWCPEPATAPTDRSVELVAYRRLPSVRHILLLAADRCAVEHHARAGPFWRLLDLGPGDVLRLEDLAVEISLDPLYEGLLTAAPEPGPAEPA